MAADVSFLSQSSTEAAGRKFAMDMDKKTVSKEANLEELVTQLCHLLVQTRASVYNGLRCMENNGYCLHCVRFYIVQFLHDEEICRMDMCWPESFGCLCDAGPMSKSG